MDVDHNPKSRGLNKFKKNKLGHGKAKPIPRIPPHSSKSKINLGSNYDRYEPEVVENKLDSRTDFALLANTPITRGNHFQFKSDRDLVDGSQIKQKQSDLFNLDLKLLDMSLGTIPFNIRSGIDDSIFSKSQIEIMSAAALENQKIYKRHIDSIKALNNGYDENLVFSKRCAVNIEESEDESDEIVEKGVDEVDDLVLPQQKVPALSSTEVSVENNEEDELKKWLDDVLDDEFVPGN